MELLVALRDLAVAVDPEQGVLYLLAVRGGFVYTNIDRETGGFSGRLEAEDKFAGLDRADKGDSFAS